MKEITLYQARDGHRFDKRSDCANHEWLLDKIDALSVLLPAIPEGCDFLNGKGYLQHNPEKLEKYRLGLLDLIEKKIDHSWVKQTRDKKAHPSYLARLLDESASPLGNAWNRLLTIDKQGREWGQPYYAENPTQGQQFCLNP